MTEQHSPAQPAAFVKLAVFENELEARQLESELLSRSIPHLVKSYRDPAYVGIVQNHRGWGHLEAPAMFREEIEQIRRDLDELAGPFLPSDRNTVVARVVGWLFLGWFAIGIVSMGVSGELFEVGLDLVPGFLIAILIAWLVRRLAERIVDMLRARTRRGS